ncbi:polysaccharide biosynthesis/export family protein [Saccharicrinis sp. FJH54]|uniref:polysaccharide biosynthesis/export family protein n=1 Tax=Saccharicrinis sp. FJH54 TaxID=3344665 RepID=UPI0035D43C28
MGKNILRKGHSLVLLLFAMLSVTSCVTKKQITYLQSPTKKIPSYEDYKPENYKVEPGDELYINVEPLMEEEQGFLSTSRQIAGGSMVGRTLSLLSYLVYDDGTIDFPYVGTIKVEGLTTREIRQKIMDVLDDYLMEQAKVTVKLVNRYISIIGDVKSPGRYEIYEEQLNIFQAIAMSGDVATYGNRAQIKIIRKVGDETVIKEFDLRSEDIIGSEYYYVVPNDVIYVEKMQGQFFRFDNFGNLFSTITSSLSFLILVLSYTNVQLKP